MTNHEQAPVQDSANVVALAYDELASGSDLSAPIERGFGPSGLGLLVVTDVPSFAELRRALLPLAFRFAALPDAVKQTCVHAESHYSFGWSHGKELLKPSQFDEFKGSYYANPQYDVPCHDAELIARMPESYHPNIWPSDADFPELAPAFKALGRCMVDVGVLVARQCDAYVEKRLALEGRSAPSRLASVIADSRACKARLLQYFPIDDDRSPRGRDSWCGWHTDHGSLTALCPAMYFEAPKGALVPTRLDVPLLDPEAGLYVRTRDGVDRKVRIPAGAMAFQIGESSQIMTGGLLRATPHAVQAPAWPVSQNLSRATYAVFMQPDGDVAMQAPEGTPEFEARVGAFVPGMTFGEFSKATFEKVTNPYG